MVVCLWISKEKMWIKNNQSKDEVRSVTSKVDAVFVMSWPKKGMPKTEKGWILKCG